MNLERAVSCAVVLGSLLFATPSARANTPEDLQGVGARANAMGGAGTALYGDFTATYYNPGALSRCTDDHVGVDIRHTMYGLDVERRGADAPAGSPKPLNDQTRVTTGFCLRLPYNISFGLSLGVGLQNLASLDQAAPSSRSQWVMYGESLQQFSIALGISYQPIEQLSVGFGGSILVNTDLSFGSNVPVAQDVDNDGYSDPLDVNLRLSILPTGAPYLGVLVTPTPRLRFGLTFRGEMFLNLDEPATIRVSALGLDVPIPIQVRGAAWYSPRQFALGTSFDATDDLTVTADVTYYNWSALGGTYYPYLAITPQRGYDDTVVGALSFPRMGNPGWKDVWVPRVGGELRLMDSRLAIRGGYGYRPSALPRPGSTSMIGNDGTSLVTNVATLLDTGVHSISLGAGYYFGERPGERQEPVVPAPGAPDPAAVPVDPAATSHVLPYDADGLELEPRDRAATAFLLGIDDDPDAFGGRGAQTRPRSGGTGRGGSAAASPPSAAGPAAPAARPTVVAPSAPSPATTAAAGAGASAVTPVAAAPADAAAIADPAAADEADPDLPGVTGEIHFFFRANLLQERFDAVKDISYGGSIYDFGIQMSLGWY